MSTGWSKAWLPELAHVGAAGTWFPIRRHFGIRAFGVNAWGADEGKDVINEHDELGGGAQGHEELYVVLSGHATFTVGGEELDAPTGTIVFVPDPATKRRAVAREDGTTVLVAGGKADEVFRAGLWEVNAQVLPLFEEQRYDEVERILNEALAENPGYPGFLYNLACVYSLTGRGDEAIDALRTAVQTDARFAEYAQGDKDFDPIREDPRFASAVAGEVTQ